MRSEEKATMKKFLLLLCIAAVLVLVPSLSGAFFEGTPLPDAVDCSTLAIGSVPVRVAGGPHNFDRFAVCVSDGVSNNGAELYIGGELHPEKITDGPCSAVVVGGKTISGDPDWIHVDKGNPLETDDDVLHDCQ
jgi:hypothetical protein